MADTDSSRDIVVKFYEAALNEKNPEKARAFLGDKYIQHNPHVPDGIEGFLRFIRFRREKFPNARNDIKRVIAEGDLVVLHVHSVVIPNSPGADDRRHLPRRGRQGGRALGRDPGDSGRAVSAAERQRAVLGCRASPL